jgi:lipoprotein NlpD
MGTDSYTPAPVMDLSTVEAIPRAGTHRVIQGETLYSIAWRYGLDYRYLAQRNHIASSYTIRVGQIIYLRGQAYVSHPSSHTQQRIHSVAIAPMQREEREPNYLTSGWMWPAKGRVVRTFTPTTRGIDIANHAGEPIRAAASGKVVYSGNGLRGYGNLIIIKHNNLYLSAYAHVRQVSIKEGEYVRKGQKIAEMGNTGSDKVILHFEIRKAGKPVNPISIFTI